MQTFEIIEKPSILNKITLCESIDVDLLKRLLLSDFLIEYTPDTKTKMNNEDDIRVSYETEKEQLVNYLKKYNEVTEEIKTLYYYGFGKEYGRVYPFKSLSLISFRRETRHTICGNIYVDIDIANAHPTILYQIAESLGKPCPMLKKYVLNRDKEINNVMKLFKTTRDIAKNLFIRLMYGVSVGISFNSWKKDNNVKDINMTRFICEYGLELDGLKEAVTEANKTKKLMKGIKKTNIGGTVMAYLCQNIERQILEQIYIYLLNNKYLGDNKNKPNGVLCFDGIMVKKSDRTNAALLVNLNKEIQAKTGFNLTFTYKDMNEGHQPEELPALPDPDSFELENVDEFNSVYLLSLEEYPIRKRYWELFACKIIGINKYMFKLNKNTSPVYYPCNKTAIVESFYEIKDFVFKWIQDATKRVHSRIEFRPYNGVYTQTFTEFDNIYNLFKGFNPLIKTPYDKSRSNSILKAFMDITFQLCEANQAYHEYFLNYIAQMVQHPEDKTIGHVVVFRGMPGNGKTLICDVIGNLLNNAHYISTANENDIFGTHAVAAENKILVNWNEAASDGGTHNKLKSFVTDKTTQVNPKNIQQYEVQLFARMIVTTNNASVIKVEVGDRRVVAFQVTDKYCGEDYATFWAKHSELFFKPVFIACLYDFFNEKDISNYNFKVMRPITDLYRDWQDLYRSPELCFIKHKCEVLIDNGEGSIDVEIKGDKLCGEYREYCTSVGLSKCASIPDKTIYAWLMQYCLKSLHKPLKRNFVFFRFNPNELYNELKTRNIVRKESMFVDDADVVKAKQDSKLIGYEFDFE